MIAVSDVVAVACHPVDVTFPIVTVMPVMTRLNGGRQLRIPAEAGYDGEVFEVGAG